MAARRIGILAVEGVQLLDVSGPADVFAEANKQAERREYDICVLGSGPGTIKSSSGMRILPDAVLGGDPLARFHTLLVAGAPHLEGALETTN
jgi:transcriptional regulator GlxA family with amidase domain